MSLLPPTLGTRSINLPQFLRIVDGADAHSEALHEVLTTASFTRPLIVSGETVSALVADRLAAQLSAVTSGIEQAFITANSRAAVSQVAQALEDHDVAIAIGGGRPIDVAKAACHAANRPVITVPTQLSADGIASPIAVIAELNGTVTSERARLPHGVVADVELLAAAPVETARAGVGDLIANRAALVDWSLAARNGHGVVDDFAALLADVAHRLVEDDSLVELRSGSVTTEFARRLLEGLVLSGIAMEVAGSSRPCSGSEHLISHALDQLVPGTASHGEQVAFGTVVATCLQGGDWLAVRRLLEAAGLDAAARGFDLADDQIIAALHAAPATRPGRFTVLDTVNGQPDRDQIFAAAITAVRG